MKDTKNTIDTTEIQKQADKLFTLIEKTISAYHEDTLAQNMSEQMGEMLKTRKGYDILEYARDLSQSRSEQAVFGLEESAYRMNDEALGKITDLYKSTLRMAEDWKKIDKLGRDEIHSLNMWVKEAENDALSVKKDLSGQWEFRATQYGKEIKELRGEK